MKSKIFRWFAIILILQIGLFQYLTAQPQYDKTPYLGYIAFANFAGAVISAFLISRRKRAGWLIGLFVVTESIVGFVLTRTVALPGLVVEPWIYPYGIIGSILGGIFILIFLFAQPLSPRFLDEEPASQIRTSYLLPLFGLLLISGITFATYRWDAFAYQIGYHVHVGSLDAVCSTPLTSFAELKQRYGLEVSLVAVTAMDSIVDVRLKVIDPEKAKVLLQNQAALLVNQEVLVLAPHHHTHWKLVPNKLHVMFFPTQNKTVYPGAEVSLVFGGVRVEPVVVH